MATSGTMTGSNAVIGGISGSHFYINWQLASQSVTNNTSKINWQAKFLFHHADAQLDNGIASLSGTRWSNGGRVHDFAAEGYSEDRHLTLASGSFTIGHNSDGTKSLSVSGGVDVYGVGRSSGSQSWSLPTIPRNSQVTTDKSTYNIGDDVKIYTNRKSSSFTHTIKIRLDDSSGTVLHTQNNVGSSWTWAPSASEITTMQNHIPNSNSLKLYIDQYNNQVKAHSDVTITEKIIDANPTYSTFTYKDADSTTTSITGNDQVLVQGKSILEVDIAAADKMIANKGASADYYNFIYDGTTSKVNYSTSAISSSFTNINTVGSRAIQVQAVDSRGNNTTATQSVVVYPYIAPIINVDIERENNFDANTDITISGTFDLLPIGGTNKNVLTTGSLKYRYKEKDASTFGSWTAVTFTVTDNTFSADKFTISLDNTKAYDFEFTITDKFGAVTQTGSVGTGKPLFFIGNNGSVGIGKLPEYDSALEVGGDIYANGEKVLTESSTKELATALTASDSVTTYAANETTINTGAYATVFDLTGSYEIISGSFMGIASGIRLTIDGNVVVNTTTQYRGSTNDASTLYGVLVVPPAKSDTSMKLEIMNTSGGKRPFGWIVYVRDVI